MAGSCRLSGSLSRHVGKLAAGAGAGKAHRVAPRPWLHLHTLQLDLICQAVHLQPGQQPLLLKALQSLQHCAPAAGTESRCTSGRHTCCRLHSTAREVSRRALQHMP